MATISVGGPQKDRVCVHCFAATTMMKCWTCVEWHTEPTLHYLEPVYFVTALVPSDTACFANSPGSSRRTAVWVSLLVIVEA
uniref:Secreted protein n=1 Tax=Mesocestoides corti TaxID=53468 RepID=A0A5K3G2X6_MESCO